MRTNADMTIYNIYYDNENDINIYQGTTIKKVHWENIQGFARRASNNIVSDDKLRIFIPIDSKTSREYKDPVDFANLVDKENFFTISPESIIVRGLNEANISRPSELKDYHIITSVDFKDYGRKSMHHWDLMAK